MLNNVKVSIFPLLIFATFVMGAIGTYGSEAETITRQYSYTSNDENDKGNNPEEKIAENGKEYEITSENTAKHAQQHPLELKARSEHHERQRQQHDAPGID